MNLRLKKRLRLMRKQFERLLARKISNRLLLTYVGLGALPLMLASVVLISLTSGTVQTYIYERNMETARRASNEIHLFVKEPLTILQTAALTRGIVEMDSFSQDNMINKIMDKNTIFRSIFVLDDSGKVVETTRFGEDGANFADRPYYRAAMQNLEYISEVSFSPSRFPLLYISEPVLRYNQVVGALVGEIELNTIWALVDSITIAKSGFAFLLDQNGRVIAHRDKNKVLEQENYSQYSFFQDLVRNGQGLYADEESGEEQVLVYARVPDLNWGVVVRQSRREAFTLARQMQIQMAIFTAVSVLVALLLGVLAVKRITRPLVRLVQGVREYGRGNLQHKIDMKTRDELAELASEFNSMAQSLLKNQKKLKRMEHLAALSRFAALVSHEIRNPLNSMNINMQLLRKLIHRPEIAAERKSKYLDVISSEIRRMNDMVTNFLTIARPPELQRESADIHNIIREVIMVQEARANFEGIKINTVFADQECLGMFDLNQLKQVFHNLLVNAFEASSGRSELFIRTSVLNREVAEDLQRPFVKIEFEDHGEGIPAEVLEEVFEYYYTTKRSGTGLGLAIAKQIVEAHNGSVYIKSEPGSGTVFFIELPIQTGK